MYFKDKYSNLFKKATWGKIESEFTMEMPEENLISNVNMVPFINEKCVIIRLESGEWEIPGGTLEKNELYADTIRRELIEEAGAILQTYVPFGAWKCFSHHNHAYKPHLPHPEFFHLVGYGNVEISSNPLILDDGEKVVAVEIMSVGEAAEKFIQKGRTDLAELYILAEELRNQN
ncbi:NUDIX hydrolase [Paenibacillus sedimenti]|uniref:NUDIX domain-containing protein n=1 Tax=Paenibacillus sedimenti TaxID=2770274 RepID=A0A926QJZ9_9BACL|nr:NUDIX domain-containing protein [Paenibacillus sedimenti]MBD0380979.1 NUDIX domain-containing protein [Paenibacillus sedimenti]